MALRPDGVDKLLTPAVYDAIDRLRSEAERRHGVECGALALAWLLDHREVTAVVTGPARGSPHLDLAAASDRRRSVGCGIRRDRILVRAVRRRPIAERSRRTVSQTTRLVGAGQAGQITGTDGDAEPGWRSLSAPNDMPVVDAGERRSVQEVLRAGRLDERDRERCRFRAPGRSWCEEPETSENSRYGAPRLSGLSTFR